MYLLTGCPLYAGLVLPFLSFLCPNSLLGQDGNKFTVQAAMLHTTKQDMRFLPAFPPLHPFPDCSAASGNAQSSTLAFKLFWNLWVQAFDSLPAF